MKPIILDVDPYSGAVETFDYDEGDDLAIVKRSCDVQPVIDINKSQHLYSDGWVTQDKAMRLEARIPVDVALLWLQRYGVDVYRREHWPAVRRLLNDPDWRYLRTSTRRL